MAGFENEDHSHTASSTGRHHLSGRARIIGWGRTPLGKLGLPASTLMRQAVEQALGRAGLALRQIGGLVAIPSLSHPHFMEAHYLATQMGLLPRKDVVVRTIDTGGAGPVTGLLEAAHMVERGWCEVAVVVAGDAVASMPSEEFLRRADRSCRDPKGELAGPVIPHGYDRVAQWQMATHGTTREQLAMCSVLMSRQAARHPDALTRRPHALAEVLDARLVAPVTGLLECARRADGGAAVVVAASALLNRLGRGADGVVIRSGGEGSGPLYPPPVIDEDMFSCEEACARAYNEAGLNVDDIDFFGLYDCFPICLIRAVEAVGLAGPGQGGAWIEDRYRRTEASDDPAELPVNTHGGLLAFGAPWEVPAMYNIIEACEQLSGRAGQRQIDGARRALVYGNGGIFSASAVAILEQERAG